MYRNPTLEQWKTNYCYRWWLSGILLKTIQTFAAVNTLGRKHPSVKW